MLWRFSNQVNLSINFWYSEFVCPHRIDEKNNTISTLEEKNKNLENKLQEALKPKFNKNSALEASAALEAVNNEVELDYDKLYAALKKLNVL